jgi:L-ascorbate metabolism protein UlaG (beta-lactamase superfamily)
MKLTKFTHSCIRCDDGAGTLVVDPGVFSQTGEALAGADAVLITHEHPDHVDVDAVRAAAAGTDLRIWAPASVAGKLADLGERVSVVEPGQTFEAAGLRIQAVGGQHALIHPRIPVVQNVGYLINESVYHPGDAFVVPTAPVDVLLVPLHAPWSKTAEVVDFVTAVRPRAAHQIHDGLLNERGLAGTQAHVARFAAEFGTDYRHLDDYAQVEI